jgi:hypothetical protein
MSQRLPENIALLWLLRLRGSVLDCVAMLNGSTAAMRPFCEDQAAGVLISPIRQ